MFALTETEKKILRIVQKNIPHTKTPYADIATACETSEEEVINLLRKLKENHCIRRFGAMIRHQKTDWVHNAMVAWVVDLKDIEAAGKQAAAFDNVSHVYYRPSPQEDWPYTFYTMVHGRTPAECKSVIFELEAIPFLKEHVVLPSVKELKKISMTYF